MIFIHMHLHKVVDLNLATVTDLVRFLFYTTTSWQVRIIVGLRHRCVVKGMRDEVYHEPYHMCSCFEWSLSSNLGA